MNDKPLVSVALITYNQEKFIRQCFDGILMQNTSFPFEIVVGEDCSTDHTRAICIEYQQKYPHLIRLIFPERNLGMMGNWRNTITSCKGKYVAICEGDDYWIDPDKLQKQVNFLENNPDFVMSTHHAVIFGHNKKMIYEPPLQVSSLTTEDVLMLKGNIPTASFVFRRESFTPPDWMLNIRNGDYMLQLLVSLKGKMHYMPEYMSVYRRHLGGATAQFSPFYNSEAFHILFRYFNNETNNKYKKLTKSKLQSIYRYSLRIAKENKLRRKATGLLIIYYFSKIGIDILPIIGKISFLSK